MPSRDAARGATVGELARALSAGVRGERSVRVRDVTHDSRQAGPGTLFAAVRGSRTDGHEHAAAAVAGGAAALLVEEFAAVPVPQIKTPDSRRALASAAAVVHGRPSHKMRVIGVTGTNGKTTVTFMLEAIAAAAGIRFGRVGTLGAAWGDRRLPLSRTTPEASDLQRLLAEMAVDGVEMVALEATSHALALHRVEDISLWAAAFTNLSQDHLDFHSDLEEYYQTKRRLFDERARHRVIWAEDEYGARLSGEVAPPVTLVGWSPAHHVSGRVRPDSSPELEMEVTVAGCGAASVRVNPGGEHNLANALVAAACAHRAGAELVDIARGLSSVPPIPGRMEPVERGQPFRVLVDYAHTPDAVRRAVAAARGMGKGRVIAVAGAAGDRDRAKRPLLGRAAAAADLAVITSDNPRSEDPADLVEQVAAGARGGGARVELRVDRARAIRAALQEARPGDVVLILGKGHETGQDFGDRVVPFDDREAVARCLDSLYGRSGRETAAHREAEDGMQSDEGALP